MNISKNIQFAKCCAAIMLLASCTGSFEDYNTNPYGVTQEEMRGDNAGAGSNLQGMIPVLVQGQQNASQMVDQMIGSEYGAHISAIATWGNKGNYYTYNPSVAWLNDSPFTRIFPQIYTGFFKIKEESGEGSLLYAWAQILRVAGSLRISDCYGPIPYSKVTGEKTTVPYDDMEALYNNMFADLDAAINVMTVALNEADGAVSMAAFDKVYGADLKKWVKFANTLKLRMALRLVNVNESLGKQKAQEAIMGGLMNSASDAAYSSYNDGMNPYYRSAFTWAQGKGEMAVSANLTSYLRGYKDPRLEKYVQDAANGKGKIGVRNGIYLNNETAANYSQFSKPNIQINDKLLVMSASEAYFLHAEAALRGWVETKDKAKEYYEKGVAVSMEERGAVFTSAYFDGSSKPEEYKDPLQSSYSHDPVSSISTLYKTTDAFEDNLERILVQKWLANFPNGWETWVDIRRTGYPKFFPVVKNLNQDGVSSVRGMRRISYPQSEYNTNEVNVKAAVVMLKGADNAATDLWWAKKN